MYIYYTVNHIPSTTNCLFTLALFCSTYIDPDEAVTVTTQVIISHHKSIDVEDIISNNISGNSKHIRSQPLIYNFSRCVHIATKSCIAYKVTKCVRIKCIIRYCGYNDTANGNCKAKNFIMKCAAHVCTQGCILYMHVCAFLCVCVRMCKYKLHNSLLVTLSSISSLTSTDVPSIIITPH